MAKVALSYGHGSDTYEKKRSKFVIVGGKVYEEHTHNATVGEKVRKIIEAHGIKTLVVQPPFGSDVPLITRTNKANAWGADLYWSIHANASSPVARGWCGFYWGTSNDSKKLAEIYAKNVKAEGFPLYSGGKYASRRGTWSDFHELRETKMTAVLTENGFMTNKEDFKYIFQNKDDYYNRIASAHAKTICEFFGIKYDPRKSEVGKETSASKPVKVDTSKGIGTATITADSLNLRKDKSLNAPVVKSLKRGGQYYVYEIDGKWYNLGGGWASAGSNGSLLSFKAHPKQEAKPESKPAEKPQETPQKDKQTMYRVIVNGVQKGAYSEDSNALAEIKKAMKDSKDTIKIERV